MFDFLLDDEDFQSYVENEYNDADYCDDYGSYKD